MISWGQILTVENFLWFILGLAGTLLLITIVEAIIKWNKKKKRL